MAGEERAPPFGRFHPLGDSVVQVLVDIRCGSWVNWGSTHFSLCVRGAPAQVQRLRLELFSARLICAAAGVAFLRPMERPQRVRLLSVVSQQRPTHRPLISSQRRGVAQTLSTIPGASHEQPTLSLKP